MDIFRVRLLVIMILAGAMNTINDKLQNSQLVTEGIHYDKYFYHPYMQTLLMFMGESLALPLYYILKRRNPQQFAQRLEEAKKQGKIIQFNILIISARAWMDLVSSTLQSIALNFVAGSVYQMMRGGTIVTTFFFSVILLKMKALRRQWVGSILTVIGILIIGISNYIYTNQQSTSTSKSNTLQIAGYILLVTSVFGNGFQFVYQQKLFRKYHIEPFFMVGVQGVTGLTTYIVLVAVFSFVPCTFGVQACVFNNDSEPFIERPDAYFRQLGENQVLLAAAIIYVLSVYVFNISGLYITKYINALARAICDVTRTILIWTVGIIVTQTLGIDSQNYRWELTDWQPVMVQLIGFSMIMCGNLVYNKIISFAWLSQIKKYEDLVQIQPPKETN